MRNWCWGDGGETLLKKDFGGNVPKNWDLWIKIHNNNSNIKAINVYVERRSTALQRKDEYQVTIKI
jgi:hypothetical protein